MDTCCLLAQSVLAIIPLSVGMQMQWLVSVLGFSVAVVAHMCPWGTGWEQRQSRPFLGSSGDGEGGSRSHEAAYNHVGGVLPPESTCRKQGCNFGSYFSPCTPPNSVLGF